MTRRTLLTSAASLTAANRAFPAPSIPIIDCHIHLFDPTRPGGVPWPPKENTALYKPALPARLRKIAEPLGVVGAIEVEASPLLEDNQWVLDQAAKDKFILGTVGDLEPGHPEFRKHFDRFHKNPMFLGIRFGNLWDRNLGTELPKPAFQAGLKLLADAGMVMDSANPNAALLADLLRTTDKVPNLRIVIDHIPRMDPAPDPATLRELAKRPQVFIKFSGILRKEGGKIPTDPAFYKPRLDMLFDIFGEDRLVYGSDWPNSDNWGEYPLALHVVKTYLDAKGPKVAEKVFWKNSLAAYRWKKRAANQPTV